MQVFIDDMGDLQSAIRKEYSAESDILRDEDAYACNKCGTRTNAARGNTFLHLPEYLIIALNRAKMVEGRLVKQNTMVSFPQVLNMEPFYRIPAVHAPLSDIAAFKEQRSDNLQYECYAVIQHRGGLRSGHYWTLARSPIDGAKATGGQLGKWRMFNDKKVTDAQWSDTQVPQSSILFYRKKGSRGVV